MLALFYRVPFNTCKGSSCGKSGPDAAGRGCSLTIVRSDTRSSVDVWSSEMSLFEKQQKSTSFSALPLLPPTVSLFSFLSVSVCVCVSLSLSLS